jgi:hypothetical protein
MDDQSIDLRLTYRITNDTSQLLSTFQDTRSWALQHANYAEREFISTGHNVFTYFIFRPADHPEA